MSEKEPPPVEEATPQPEETEHYAAGFRLALVLASMTLVFFLMMLDMSILATVSYLPQLFTHGFRVLTVETKAIPYITRDFDSLLDVGWYGSAYQLARYIILSLRQDFTSQISG